MNIQTAIALPDDGSLSLAIPEAATFEDWQDIGRRLFARSKVVNWWIGDWWAFGEHRYGERAAAAARGLFGREFGTLANYGTISRAFEASRRREVLPYSAYVEIAPLLAQNPREAEELLDRAEREGLSVRDLRSITYDRKVALGLAQPRAEPEKDTEYSDAVMIARAWNRANREGRKTFLDLANEADLGVIDP